MRKQLHANKLVDMCRHRAIHNGTNVNCLQLPLHVICRLYYVDLRWYKNSSKLRYPIGFHCKIPPFPQIHRP